MNQEVSLQNPVSQKRLQKCGRCGQIGHNKRSCKVIIEEPQIEPLITHSDDQIKKSKKFISAHSHDIQVLKINEMMENYQNNVISDVYEKEFIDDERFNNIDDFKKYFLENLINEYPDYNLWYLNQEELSLEITEFLLQNPEINHIPVTSQCGSGKTMSMDAISKRLMTIPPIEDYTKLIKNDNIYVFTGYSSKDWINDMKKNLKIIKPENVFHRDTIRHLKDLIVKDYKRLLNAVFFIDEARLVVQTEMTIDLFFKELGLEPDIINKYNIKIFYIDATLDSHNISLKDTENVSPIFQMKTGENYIGVNHSMDNWLKTIDKYNLKHEVGFKNVFKRIKKLLKENKKKHLFRITDPKTRSKFIKEINNRGYSYYLVDSSKNSNQWGEHSFDKELSKQKENVTIYILKDMYRCAKRFRLNEDIGIIYEQDTDSDTVTTQGLIARFFGYYNDLTNINPFMICNTNHFKNQIFELETGKPHKTYKTQNVKGHRLLKATWNSELLNSTENSKRTIKKYFDDGYITSGSICKELVLGEEYNNSQHNIDLLYNNEMMDRCELFNNIEECKKRIKDLTNLDFTGKGHNTYKTKEIVNGLGNITIFSHMKEKKDILDKKWEENPLLITYQVYCMKDETEKKYALRWIAKF